MKTLFSVLLTCLLIGCGSKGDSLDLRDGKIGDQESSDFYLDLASDQGPGLQAYMFADSRFIDNNHRVRPRLRINSDRTFIYRHQVEIYRQGVLVRERNERVDGTWSVDGTQIRFSGLGLGTGRFNQFGERIIDLRINKDFQFVDIRDEDFSFQYRNRL